MKASVIIIGCAALLACGVANMDMTPTPPTKIKTVKLPAPPPRTITKTKTVRVNAPVSVPDGYMTKAVCKNLRKEDTMRAIVAHYGWPAGSKGDDSDSVNMYYPMSHDPESSAVCEITYYDGQVDFVEVKP